MPSPELTYKRILTFWLPLAGTWFMMAVEGPFLAAVIARLPGPTENLAAFGVAFAVAIFAESPVIMLMAASTALVEDHQSYLALRRFAYGLAAALTLCMLIVLIPPIFEFLSGTLLRLDEDIARLTHAGLLLLIPWPAAIAYRRLRQGLLIRRNLTRLVAFGTVIRLATMSLTAVIASRVPQLSGVVVATAALSAGVLVEALASRLMSRRVVSQLLRPEEGKTAKTPLTFGQIVTFYAPLALTSLLALAVQPMVTFFLGRSRLPRESPAALPVIHGLTFIFRSAGLSYQEVGIALLGERWEHYERLRNFAALLGLAASTGLGVIAFSPTLDALVPGAVRPVRRADRVCHAADAPPHDSARPLGTAVVSALAARPRSTDDTDHGGVGHRGRRGLPHPATGHLSAQHDRRGRRGP